MASNYVTESNDQPDDPAFRSHRHRQEEYSGSEEDDSDGDSSDTDSSSGSDSELQCGASQPRRARRQVCQYYNQGHCKYGRKCRDLHVCKYFMQGECRYGSTCKLRHISNSKSESSSDESRGEGRRRRRNSSSSREREARDSRPYTWQLDSGNGWKDIANDHIIEAQYSRPSVKGINLYNTRFGKISIDFSRMKVRKKNQLRIRRCSSKHSGLETEWVWYYKGNHDWIPYGQKDSKGNAASVTNSQIEREFQSRRKSTLRFTVDKTDYQINFRDMRQQNLSSGQRRRVARRPRYRGPQDGGRGHSPGSVVSPMKKLGVSSSGGGPTWQFKGDQGKWHDFKQGRGRDTECSVSSADIEAEYQRNPQGSMRFSVGKKRYTLDFRAMRQTSEVSHKTRVIRRMQQ
ncbi:protein mono-ADP-ribosyltransferase PARP12 [Megalops cyprinoides]|uniref:protein mono-ADP-ribosyltransferase PARP12 n=1 Tax=Megalops cyprinoides TaxID=118141 RepID=UPI0018649106|nr:protein mono-ADP-ribosyltransferase PARP12 [Megalops cyprinoides]